MPGDDKSEPPLPPPTMEGLAAMMTKLLSSMGDMETRFTSMESRITSMESRLQPPPTLHPTASMPYGMPGYGSTTLASSSSTAAATLSMAPPTSSPTLPIIKITLPHSPSPLPVFDDIPQPDPLGAPGAPGAASAHERLGVPRFSKLDFPTYDGTEDPLNWLHRCEQFFRGQRTLASDRVWLASYHMTGVTQTWYYALEQDEGMPSWERFKELANQRLGSAIRSNRLSELARLPWHGTVQDFQERFNSMVCHTPELSPKQKADLFVGGLPDHIRVDVELRTPQTLQDAMHLARAFERRAAATATASPQRAGHLPQRLPLPPPAAPRAAPPAPALPPPAAPAPALPAPPPKPFRRLTPAEMVERRRQGLCYNCDEPYVRGHQCQRLFYLEVADYTSDGEDDAAAGGAGAQPTEEPDPVVSLHAIAGIRTEDTMMVPVHIGGHRLTALLDSGSTQLHPQGFDEPSRFGDIERQAASDGGQR